MKIDIEELKALTDPVLQLNFLREKVLEDLKKGDGSVNLLIAKIREANRIWNKLTEENTTLRPDGFLIVMKDFLAKMDMPEVDRALRYL